MKSKQLRSTRRLRAAKPYDRPAFIATGLVNAGPEQGKISGSLTSGSVEDAADNRATWAELLVAGFWWVLEVCAFYYCNLCASTNLP